MNHTRDTAVALPGRTRRLAGEAQDKLTSTGDEARRRASAAIDILAGRPARKPWGLALTVATAGAVIGWAVAELLSHGRDKG